MAKNLFMLYFNPYALGTLASDDLSVFEKKEDMLFFHSIRVRLCLNFEAKISVFKRG